MDKMALAVNLGGNDRKQEAPPGRVGLPIQQHISGNAKPSDMGLTGVHMVASMYLVI